MGIATVAVYSEADRGAKQRKHGRRGRVPGPVARQPVVSGTQKNQRGRPTYGCGRHSSGYGFLSENASFARLREAKITLIGPSPRAWKSLSSKLAAKNAVKAIRHSAGGRRRKSHRILRGSGERQGNQVSDPPLRLRQAAGAKSMRVVRGKAESRRPWPVRKSKAKNAFGDGSRVLGKIHQVLKTHRGTGALRFTRQLPVPV